MSGNSISDIDFEHWATLASTDPQKFEQLRQDKISAIIDRTTGRRQQRLRGLQWQIDAIRDQHKDSAMAACLAISELMWETFEHLAELLQAQAENGLSAPIPLRQANIIPFPALSEV
ncbi:MAG: hypothetical protein BMS9Abin31_0707 [Gammaproteobacteria bacterium]|nr:MAG: hypothetical protein BMS9Abin31_0707 [Gammaproteobacteria bacterium]